MAAVSTGEEKRILIVGLACLDIVSTVDRYPAEDEDMRALSQKWKKGGNAANTAAVLSRTLDTSCELLCSFSAGMEAQFVRKELEKLGVLLENCPLKENCGFPTSCVIVNSTSGSRTIVHARNELPELVLEDFDKLDLNVYRWIHFEGRSNIDKIVMMIKKVKSLRQAGKLDVVISAELEKKRSELILLLQHVDVAFIGKDFATFFGYSTPQEAVEGLSKTTKACLICPWAASGAAAKDSTGKIYTSPAFRPRKVIDTLGAGDTFIAGVISCLCKRKTMRQAIFFGCKLAGKKCGIMGFEGLVSPTDVF